MIYKNRAIASLSIIVTVLILNCTSNAEQEQKLPRNYGPLYLGMSVKEFKKMFVTVDIGRCVHCTEDELQAALTIDKDRAEFFNISPVLLSNGSIKYQPATLQPEMILCFFYKGVLYRIELVDVKDISKSVKGRYVKALGKPTSVNVWNTGVSEVKWVKTRTSLRVLYSTEEEGIDSEMVIIYTDLEIAKRMPKDID